MSCEFNTDCVELKFTFFSVENSIDWTFLVLKNDSKPTDKQKVPYFEAYFIQKCAIFNLFLNEWL